MLQYVLASMLAFLSLFCIILMTTLQISIHFKRKGSDDLVVTRMRAWFGLLRFQNEVSVIQLAEDLSGTTYQMEMESPQEPLDQISFTLHPQELVQLQHRLYDLIKHIHALHRIAKRFLKTITVHRFEWQSAIGTGEADQTGMLYGMCWGVKTNILGLASSYLDFQTKPHLHIEPHFQEKKLETELKCMIHLTIGYAILAGIRMLINLRKRRGRTWQNTPYRA